MLPPLSIAINSFRRPKAFCQCMRSLMGQIRPDDEIVITDQSGPSTRLDSEWSKPNVRFFARENHGFGAMANHNVSQARHEWVFVTNDDFEFPDGFVETLRSAVSDQFQNTLAVVGWIRNRDGSFHYAGSNLTVHSMRIERVDLDAPTGPRDIDYFIGGLACFNRHRFTKMGGFDARFFAYSEDDDLCLRAKKAGLKIVQHPSLCAQAIDTYSKRQSSPGLRALKIRNGSVVLWRHLKPGKRLLGSLRHFASLTRNQPDILAHSTLEILRSRALLQGFDGTLRVELEPLWLRNLGSSSEVPDFEDGSWPGKA